MTGLEIIGDSAGMWKESVSAIASGMSGMGAGELGSTLGKLSSALDVFAGSLQIAGGVATALSMINAANTAEALAETSANVALGPIGWAKVAAAIAAASIASTVTFGITTYTLRGDLSTPSGVQGVSQSLGVVL